MVKEHKMKNIFLIILGVFAIWIFFISEIMLDISFAAKLPDYDWKSQSISYLGQSGSPVEYGMMLWGFAFSILVCFFSIGFYQAFQERKWVKLATIFLVIYGLGEGIGSGLFPINPADSPLTLDARLHNIFSGIGDAGIVLLPFVLMLVFPKKENQKFHYYLWTVVLIGMWMASLFLIAKYFKPDNFVLHFKGVWQRIYIINYHLMLLAVSIKMIDVTRKL